MWGSHGHCRFDSLRHSIAPAPRPLCCCESDVNVDAGRSAGGTCKGQVGSLLDQCDVDNSCFNLESGQMVLQPGAPLSPWLIGIQQCIKVCFC